MRQAVICAFLIILASGVPEFVNGEEADRETGYPLHLYLGTENQVYGKDDAGKASVLQQHTVYTGLTLKPFGYGWFHLGAKSRYTSLSAESGFYAEPVSLHLTATFMAVKDFLYASAGLQLPLAAQRESFDNREIYGDGFNNFTPISHPNILPLNSIHLGGYLKRIWGPLRFQTGVTYLRPAFYEFYEGYQEFAAPFTNLKARLEILSSDFFQRITGKITIFGWEKDKQNRDQESHMEGTLYQIRYEARFHSGSSGWGTAAGASVKDEDESRKNTAENANTILYNYNLQRFYAEVNWAGLGVKNTLMQWSFSPSLIYRKDDGEFGFQIDPSYSVKFRAGKQKSIHLSLAALYGQLADEGIYGGSVKISYSLRRLPGPTRLYPHRKPI